MVLAASALREEMDATSKFGCPRSAASLASAGCAAYLHAHGRSIVRASDRGLLLSLRAQSVLALNRFGGGSSVARLLQQV